MAKLRYLVSVLLAGVMVGLVGGALGAEIVEDMDPAEPSTPMARRFMDALITRDLAAIDLMRPDRDVITRALELKGASSAGEPISAATLTRLGGTSLGTVDLEVWVIEAEVDGLRRAVPYTLTFNDHALLRMR